MTAKQRRFVAELAAGKTQRAAALAAGYSPKTVDSIAAQTLKLPKVQAAIDAANARSDAIVDLSAAAIKRALADTAGEAREAKQYGAAVSGYGKLLDKCAPDLSDPEAKLEIRVARK